MRDMTDMACVLVDGERMRKAIKERVQSGGTTQNYGCDVRGVRIYQKTGVQCKNESTKIQKLYKTWRLVGGVVLA